jgi:hypothetical protein
LFKKGTFSAMFLIGILNGFLPCGFVYIGLAGAIASGDAISGAAVMILFGLGTVPAMFAASVLGKFINIGIRTKLRRATPYLAIVLALIFIMRGMNLGIPYLSPKLSAKNVNLIIFKKCNFTYTFYVFINDIIIIIAICSRPLFLFSFLLQSFIRKLRLLKDLLLILKQVNRSVMQM